MSLTRRVLQRTANFNSKAITRILHNAKCSSPTLLEIPSTVSREKDKTHVLNRQYLSALSGGEFSFEALLVNRQNIPQLEDLEKKTFEI
jgi:tRNA G18 (ribose-2'-O)-methylase SpoU